MTDNELRPNVSYLEQLLRDLGVVTPITHGSAAIEIDGNIFLQLDACEDGTINLVVPLPQPSGTVSAVFLRRLLEANFLWQGSRGSVFGLSAGIPVLMSAVDVSRLTYQEFRSLFEVFVNTAESWIAASGQAAAEAFPPGGAQVEQPSFDALCQMRA